MEILLGLAISSIGFDNRGVRERERAVSYQIACCPQSAQQKRSSQETQERFIFIAKANWSHFQKRGKQMLIRNVNKTMHQIILCTSTEEGYAPNLTLVTGGMPILLHVEDYKHKQGKTFLPWPICLPLRLLLIRDGHRERKKNLK